MHEIEEQLLKELESFTAFARSRVGDSHLAADLVQDSLLKAIKGAGQLRAGENVTAWFYRILRHTIIDLYRRRDVSRRTLEKLELELNAPPDAELHRTACACLEGILPTLKPEYAELIRRIDLNGATLETLVKELGTTQNNLRVRHHRARAQLRERLEATCRLCATHGCLDCTCDRQ